MSYSAQEFADTVVRCADASTLAERIAADRGLCGDEIARIKAWGFFLSPGEAEAIEAGARGGPARAAGHFFYGRDNPPRADAAGNANGLCAGPNARRMDCTCHRVRSAPDRRGPHVEGY